MRGKTGRNIGRRLVLGHDRGPGKGAARRQPLATIDRHVGRPAAAAVEHRPAADRHGLRRGRGGALRSRRIGLGRDLDRPAQDLDGGIGNVALEQHGVVALVGSAQRLGIAGGQRPLRQHDHDLVALADVAHEGDAALEGLHAAGTRRHQRRRLGAHLGEKLRSRGGVECIEPHVAAAHQLVGHRRRQEPDRRADTGIGRHDHTLDADLLGDPGGMQRRAAAEGDQIVLVDHGAALDGMHAGGAGHVLGHHLVDGISRHVGRQSQPFGDVTVERALGGVEIERDRAAGEMRRIDGSQHDIGVGHRRMAPAAAIARGPRLGAGAFRPHSHAFQYIEPGNRAAACPDFDHLDHRDANRQA